MDFKGQKSFGARVKSGARRNTACAPWAMLLPDAVEGLLTEAEQRNHPTAAAPSSVYGRGAVRRQSIVLPQWLYSIYQIVITSFVVSFGPRNRFPLIASR